MSAPVLNLGFLPPATAAGAGGATADAGAAGGFEALLAALFGPAVAADAGVVDGAPPAGDNNPAGEEDPTGAAEAVAGAQLLAAPLPAAPQPATIDADAQGAEASCEAIPGSTASGKAPAGPAAPAGETLIPDGAQPAPATPVAAAPAKPAAPEPPAPPPAPRSAEASVAPSPPPATATAITPPPATSAEAAVIEPPAEPVAGETRSKPQASDRRNVQRAMRGATEVAGAPTPTADAQPADRAVNRLAPAPPAAAGPETVKVDDTAAKPAEAAAGDANSQGVSGSGAANAALSAAHAQTVPVRGAPETVAHLAANILKKLEGRSTRFDVELEPAGLGRVDVRVEIGANGRLTAAMAFDNPQAAAELKSRAGELARTLERAGFDVSGGLSFDMANDQGRSGRNNGGETAGQAMLGRAFQATLEATADAPELLAPGKIYLNRRALAGVDIRI